MILTEIPNPNEFHKDYIEFAQATDYPLDTREVQLEQLLKWCYSLVQTAPEVFDNPDFLRAYYDVQRNMSPRVSLFFTREYLEKIFAYRHFNAALLVKLSELFLRGSQEFATAKGREHLQAIPEVLPENRSSLEGVMTKVSNCFRLSEVIAFYGWLIARYPADKIFAFNNKTLFLAIEAYRTHLKDPSVTTKSLRKNTDRFMFPAQHFLKKAKAEQPILVGSPKNNPSPENNYNAAKSSDKLPVEEVHTEDSEYLLLPDSIRYLNDNKALSVSKTATILGIDRHTVTELCKSGKIISFQPAGKNGKRIIFVKQVKQFLLGCRA